MKPLQARPGEPGGDELATGAATIVDIIHQRALARPERSALVFLERGEHPTQRDSYGSLDLLARRLAARLVARGLRGRPVLLACDSGLSFVHAFLGCLYAGVFPVPVPAVARREKVERLQLVARDARPVAAIADNDLIVAALEGDAPPLLRLDELLAEGGDPLPAPLHSGAAGIAFIQYTSGSTSAPKGVVVTHGNILANEAMIREAFGHDEDTVVVSWLPLHHDMGLIGSILQPLWLGGQCVLMSPLHFLQRPLRWLKAVQDWKAGTSGAPNFAYELCLRHVSAEEAAGLDLSHWKLAFCGSEPVRPGTMRRFAERFAPAGFRAQALYPCYGMAEATLFIAGPLPGAGARSRSFARRGFAEFTTGGAEQQEATDCGFARGEGRVAIVDPASGRELADGEVGEICVAGPHLSPGLWTPSRPDGTRPFEGRLLEFGGRRWLRSGDAGIVSDGGLHVVGRLKDMVIIRGANLYAEDIEQTLLEQPQAADLEAAAVIALEQDAAESVVVLCELSAKVPRRGLPRSLANALRDAVARHHGVQPARMVLLRPRSLPRTTSGKIQRGVARAAWLEGRLPEMEWTD